MEKQKGNDYNIFTKQELVNFLNKYDSYCWHIHNPFDIMIEDKMDAIMKRMDEINCSQHDLNIEFKSFDEKVKWISATEENNKQWKKLIMEYEWLSKLRFGE